MRAAFFILIALALAVSLAVAEDASPKGPQEERGTFKNKRGVVIATREWRSYEDEVGAEGKPISAVVRDEARRGCMALEFPAHSLCLRSMFCTLIQRVPTPLPRSW